MKLALKSCLLGNWPSKWLFRMARTVTLVVQLGILPAMLLLLISKRVKKLNSKFVRLPVNWLSLKLKNTKLVKLKWVENISPWNLLPDNINVRKSVQFFPNSFGTFPEKLLRDKSNFTNFLMRPIEGGRSPSKLFLDKVRYFKFESTIPKSFGSRPPIWLFDTSISIIPLIGCCGRWNSPVKELFLRFRNFRSLLLSSNQEGNFPFNILWERSITFKRCWLSRKVGAPFKLQWDSPNAFSWNCGFKPLISVSICSSFSLLPSMTTSKLEWLKIELNKNKPSKSLSLKSMNWRDLGLDIRYGEMDPVNRLLWNPKS